MEDLPDFDSLVTYCTSLSLPPIPTDFKGKYTASMVDMLTVDFVKKFPIGYVPLSVGKDGNCYTESDQ